MCKTSQAILFPHDFTKDTHFQSMVQDYCKQYCVSKDVEMGLLVWSLYTMSGTDLEQGDD